MTPDELRDTAAEAFLAEARTVMGDHFAHQVLLYLRSMPCDVAVEFYRTRKGVVVTRIVKWQR